MFSDQTIAIVKSTAPLLEEHGEALTQHFYRRMFAHNPEVAPFFNQANQSGGRQQRALAAAIAGYAAHIDNLEALTPTVELIAQKHVSLQIQPEHYPIVGENLLASIAEVLSLEAADPVLGAWAEAYGFLADILIARERDIYRENATRVGGWQGFREFRVQRKQPESSNITSFYLTPVDGAPLPAFQPGQYITLRATQANGQRTFRNYSLSDKPGQEHFRISVKRETGLSASEPPGFVSNLLHDHVEVGSILDLAPPCGEFFLDVSQTPSRPLALLAAGVGVTPLLSMLLSALEACPSREIVFLHCCLNEEVQAFRATIASLASQHPHLKAHFRYSEPSQLQVSPEPQVSVGLVDADLIESLLPERDADYYFCGPQPFMTSVYQLLSAWKTPAPQMRFEFFGPRQELVKKVVVRT